MANPDGFIMALAACAATALRGRFGVEHFGQSGSLPELYGHYGLEVNSDNLTACRDGDQRASSAVPLLAEVCRG
jgi:pyruvate dehydrogenase complex dehydrogenase (E1) component